jgi:hypothetical protein
LTPRRDTGRVTLIRPTLIVLATAVLFALPATADAAKRATTADPVSAAAAVGTGFWGTVPCGGRITYRTRSAQPPVLSERSDAWVTFNSALGANDLSAAPATYTDCTVSFGRSRWPDTASMTTDWDMFCMTMVHELGHLLGHAHDLAAASVMAPVFTDYSAEPAACRAARPSRR